MQTLTTDKLKFIAGLGNIDKARLVAAGPIWHIEFTAANPAGTEEYVLVTEKNTPRAFTKADSAVRYLIALNIPSPYAVDCTDFDPDSDEKIRRPAQSARMRETYKKANGAALTDENGNCLSCGQPALGDHHEHCETGNTEDMEVTQ